MGIVSILFKLLDPFFLLSVPLNIFFSLSLSALVAHAVIAAAGNYGLPLGQG